SPPDICTSPFPRLTLVLAAKCEGDGFGFFSSSGLLEAPWKACGPVLREPNRMVTGSTLIMLVSIWSPSCTFVSGKTDAEPVIGGFCAPFFSAGGADAGGFPAERKSLQT